MAEADLSSNCAKEELETKTKFDFSIESILKIPYFGKSEVAFPHLKVLEKEGSTPGNFCPAEEFPTPVSGESPKILPKDQSRSDNERQYGSDDGNDFSWLYCSRFKPPKLPRSKKRSNRKRYGRGPRIPFAAHQIAVLENAFKKSHYLSPDCINRLAESLYLSETRVKIWFQNRRARFRREQEMGNLPGSAGSERMNPLTLEDIRSQLLAGASPENELTDETSTKVKRRRPNVSSCSNTTLSGFKENDGGQSEFRNPQRTLQEPLGLPPATATEADHPFPSVNVGNIYPFSSSSPPLLGDVLINHSSGFSAMNHFSKILFGGSSSAFVPMHR